MTNVKFSSKLYSFEYNYVKMAFNLKSKHFLNLRYFREREREGRHSFGR